MHSSLVKPRWIRLTGKQMSLVVAASLAVRLHVHITARGHVVADHQVRTHRVVAHDKLLLWLLLLLRRLHTQLHSTYVQNQFTVLLCSIARPRQIRLPVLVYICRFALSQQKLIRTLLLERLSGIRK